MKKRAAFYLYEGRYNPTIYADFWRMPALGLKGFGKQEPIEQQVLSDPRWRQLHHAEWDDSNVEVEELFQKLVESGAEVVADA